MALTKEEPNTQRPSFIARPPLFLSFFFLFFFASEDVGCYVRAKGNQSFPVLHTVYVFIYLFIYLKKCFPLFKQRHKIVPEMTEDLM